MHSTETSRQFSPSPLQDICEQGLMHSQVRQPFELILNPCSQSSTHFNKGHLSVLGGGSHNSSCVDLVEDNSKPRSSTHQHSPDPGLHCFDS